MEVFNGEKIEQQLISLEFYGLGKRENWRNVPVCPDHSSIGKSYEEDQKIKVANER